MTKHFSTLGIIHVKAFENLREISLFIHAQYLLIYSIICNPLQPSDLNYKKTVNLITLMGAGN